MIYMKLMCGYCFFCVFLGPLEIPTNPFHFNKDKTSLNFFSCDKKLYWSANFQQLLLFL